MIVFLACIVLYGDYCIYRALFGPLPHSVTASHGWSTSEDRGPTTRTCTHMHTYTSMCMHTKDIHREYKGKEIQ